MKPRKAIRILENQIAKLHQLNDYHDTVWISQTRSYIISMFGDDSEEKSFLHYFVFIGLYTDEYNYAREFAQKKIKAEQFLQGCIVMQDAMKKCSN